MGPRWQVAPPPAGESPAAHVASGEDEAAAACPRFAALLGEDDTRSMVALSQLVELCHSNLVVCRTEAQIAASRRAVQSKLHELGDLRCGAVCYAMHG